ncbi:helix-turn-helix transcriptional regulator [Aeromonas salmonicida]|uniref:helix-turn-helix transcriptional regulator n=1 Tax=Aeromonas salmonicida TaxID=645 RepID=UPI000A1149A4|nr:AlpA family phage regulatory protein [Aeromonas salmonicida]
MSLHVSSELPIDGFVRAGTLAKVLGISVVTVWRWSAAGKLPKPVKISGKVTGWPVADVRAWIAEKSNPTSQPASN